MYKFYFWNNYSKFLYTFIKKYILREKMRVKVKNTKNFYEQIKDIDWRIKNIIKELDHIKQSNQILTMQIQEILDKSDSW